MKNFTVFIFFICILSSINAQVAADKAIQLKIVTQKSPAQIKLSWAAVGGTTTSYSVYRKDPNSTNWGTAVASVPFTGTLEYSDNTVNTGQIYEYKVIGIGGYAPWGYAMSGIEAPNQETGGRVILLVDNTVSAALSTELQRLKEDLIAEGWLVTRHDVSRTATPPSVKNLIVSDYNTLGDVKTVFIIGHVPVPYSGNIAPDGHTDHIGAWAADCYYGDINGTWADVAVNSISATRAENRNIANDGKFDQSSAPNTIELPVGRVDMYNLPAFSSTETALLRMYLNKDHDFRRKNFTVKKRGFISDNFGYFGGEAFAASAWRNFSALLSPENIVSGGNNSYFGMTGDNSFLWAYGCGGGTYQGAGGIGTTTNYASTPIEAVFLSTFGSYFGDWDSADNFLRAGLANSGKSLVNFWSGRPHWVFHGMGMGGTIGESLVATQNNKSSQYNIGYTKSVHIALMGDPTLRMTPVAPPTNAVASNLGVTNTVTWTASTDAGILGYNVYRAANIDGVFTKLTSNFISSRTFIDNSPLNGSNIYSIRAVKLEATGSGSFYNYSGGIITQPVNIVIPPLPCTSVTTSITGKTNICGTRATTLIAATNAISPTYLWSTGATTASINATTANIYRVTVTQSDGCTKTASAIISGDKSCRCNDSLELVSLYNATGGGNWTNEWILTQPMTTWYGVTLNATGCVACIDLDGIEDCNATSGQGNNLNGTIPNLNLPNLQTLSLQRGAFANAFLSGTIPNFNLPNLVTLNLQSNQLSGAIPNFNLPNLVNLYLSSNQLSGTLPNFNLPKLVNLEISDTQLSGTIPNFNLPNLQVLALSSNQLSGAIPNFNLPNLRNLYLNSNQLSGCIAKGIKTNCPLAIRGNIANNPNLATQNWVNYWNNGEGACVIASVEMMNSDETISVYPNPFKDNVMIETNLKGAHTIGLFDVAGRLLQRHNVNQSSLQLSTSDLPSGVYTIVVTSNTFKQIFKIVK
jgi:Secretion system C-terminal sorting domain